jgi:hypothetical protein
MPANPPKPDRWSVERWYNTAPTVGDMQDQGWQVLAECDACKFLVGVNLKTLIEKRGRSYSLWNVRAECRRAFPKPFVCLGFMYFQSQPPGCARTFKLWVDEAILKHGPFPAPRRDCGWL